MAIFVYGPEEIAYLKSKDEQLGAAIDKIGMLQRELKPDPFSALVSSVISQQISNKAAATVWQRFQLLLGQITPENIGQTDIADIKGCGMSEKKAGYIKGIAAAALEGVIDFKQLHTMADAEIIQRLSALKGVGVWTAEMLLIFSLCRPDVVSFRDLAICRGMMKLYGLTELPSEKFAWYRQRYSPYGSVASLYLWAVAVS
ncbi:MAG: DNA-3-methyladenine glycosylase 2 family protein [Peptococcaceae bacterium]|nr:DNA-3-methyladenine glycosylase 2 family protein [Peptococcaceae bacterium]